MRYLVVLDLLFSHFFFPLRPLYFFLPLFLLIFWQDYSGLWPDEKKKKRSSPNRKTKFPKRKRKKKVMTTKKWNRYMYTDRCSVLFFFSSPSSSILQTFMPCTAHQCTEEGHWTAPFMISSISCFSSSSSSSFVFKSVIHEKVKTRDRTRAVREMTLCITPRTKNLLRQMTFHKKKK